MEKLEDLLSDNLDESIRAGIENSRKENEEVVECSCDDPSCPQKGEEDDYVSGHIEECTCHECHHAIGKLR